MTVFDLQEALQSLRKIETGKPEEPRDQILEESECRILPVSLLNISDTEEQLEYKSHFASLRFTTLQLDREEENLHNQHVHSHFLSKQMQNGDQTFNDKHNTTKETEQRDRGKNGHCESKRDIVNNLTVERRVTWNHKMQSQKKSNAFPQQDSFVKETNKSTGPHNLLVGELRENKLPTSGQFLLPSKFTPAESAIIVGQQQSQKPDLRQDSWSHQSGDENEPLSDSWTFTRILNSPRLRRKRPMNSQPSAPLQGPRRMSADVGSSKSVSDSEENHNFRRPSNTSVKTEDHLVLKMASVKQNRSAFWNVPYERSSDSESELNSKETHNKNFHQKIPKIKPQRSESFPEIKSSPLQGLLNRAMERERERGIAKIEGKHLEKTSLQSSNTDCTTLSSSPRTGESEAEEWVIFKARWFGPHTRTETSVDSSDNDRKNRYFFNALLSVI